jgi:hypothetical protein
VNLLWKDVTSWPKIHLPHLLRLGKDVKDAKDEIAVLLMFYGSGQQPY